jgi:hypothetical protein
VALGWTDNNCAENETETTFTPVVAKLKPNAAPGSPKVPFWRIPSARFASAACVATVSVAVTPGLSADATLRKLPLADPQSVAAGVKEDESADTSVPSVLADAPVNTRHPGGSTVPIPSKF